MRFVYANLVVDQEWRRGDIYLSLDVFFGGELDVENAKPQRAGRHVAGEVESQR